MSLPKPLSCSEVSDRRLLKALLNRRLDTEYEDRILAHLRICPSCLSTVASVLNEIQQKNRQNEMPRYFPKDNKPEKSL